MQSTIFFLCLAMLMAASTLESGAIFDYTNVAPCARSCSILAIAEGACVPPIAPIANETVYLSCFCQSSYLKTLHDGGGFCHETCSKTDTVAIHSYYYYSLCESATPPQALPPSSSTTTSSFATNEPTIPLSSSTDNQSKAQEPETWLHSNWKTLFVAVIVGVFALAGLSCLAWLYWRRRNADTKKANRENGLIPLQSLPASRLTRSVDTPPRSHDLGSEENLPVTVLASPLAPARSPHSFGETLMFYAEQERDREEAMARTRILAELIRSHSRPSLAPDEV